MNEKEMPPVLVRWLDNLRSGNIKQARGEYFREDGSMCVLGVGKYSSAKGRASSRNPLDWELFEDCGLGQGSHVDVIGLMVDANDSGVGFAQLADWLEELWKARRDYERVKELKVAISAEIYNFRKIK